MYPLRRQDGAVTSHPSGLHHPFPTNVKSDPKIRKLNQNNLIEILGIKLAIWFNQANNIIDTYH